MCGVMRIEGMRPFCARRRTVDSLTCRIAASCRAVKNSSRELVCWGVASVIFGITPCSLRPLLFRRALNCEGDAIDHCAVYFHIFRLRLCAVCPDSEPVCSFVRRETKDCLPCLVRQPTINLSDCAVGLNARKLYANVWDTVAAIVEDAAPQASYGCFVDGQNQPVRQRRSLSSLDLYIFQTAYAQASLAKSYSINARRKTGD